MKISHLLAFLVLVLFSCKNTRFTSVAKYNNQLPGQSAPPDMVFVPGNDSIESFYIGVIEEPNINYVMYLRWLLLTHVSNPSVFWEAMPQSDNSLYGVNVNEEYVLNYLINPRCAYYPVTGLTWLQIQKYLQWKTDRLNEAILVETGMINKSVDEQFDDNNFNTEAYLSGQYHPYYRRLIKRGGAESQVHFSDGIFFTGFRLPTVAEWQLAQHEEVAPNTKRQNKSKKPHHIFGSNYYPIQIQNWNVADEYGYNLSGSIWSYEVDYSKLEFGDATFRVDSAQKQWAKLILNYPKKAYGPINMRQGVDEWLLNHPDHPNANWLQAYQKTGFKTFEEAVVRTDDGEMADKDSIGRMSFRIIGVKGLGYIPIGHESDYEMVRVLDSISFPDSLKSGMDSMDVPKFHQRLIMNSKGQLESLHEDKARSDVGFRCVLPYTGAPVRKGFKVKW